VDIETFKSYLLEVTENKPFYLKHHMKNTETVKDLIQRTRDWNKEILGAELIPEDVDSEVLEED